MAGAKLVGGTSMDQLIRGERKMFSTTDDNALMKAVLATHSPDGREIDVQPILNIVEDILYFATLDKEAMLPDNGAANEDKSQLSGGAADVLEALSYTIHRLSTEIAYRCLDGSDAHSTTLFLLTVLSSFPWDAKLVLTLAAFSLNYGEFWLLSQIHMGNRLAKSMAILRQVHSTFEYANHLKPRFDALKDLLKSMIDLTKCVIEFRKLPSSYISTDESAFSAITAAIPTVTYWIIRGVAAAATNIANLNIGVGNEYAASTTEAWELASLAHKITNISDFTRKHLVTCFKIIEEKKQLEAYEMLVRLFGMIHIDNMKILKSLIYAKDDQHPLFNGRTKTRVSLDVLRSKMVLLLISGLDISNEQLMILEQLYSEKLRSSDHNFEIVWIPILDHSVPFSDSMDRKFQELQAMSSWYSVSHPALIDGAVIRFIKDKFHFKNEAILVVLDPHGKVVNDNALHMMWIWGSSAFDFTSEREKALWKREIWNAELIVNGIDPTILEWINHEKFFFLYGGKDIQWIQNFTSRARGVAMDAGIPLEMVYISNGSNPDQARKVTMTIAKEMISYCWQDSVMSWFFWTRLESMLFSKIKLGITNEDETMMRELKKLLSYGKGEGEWAMLSKGKDIIVTGHGPTVVTTLGEFDRWSDDAKHIGFADAFTRYYKTLHPHPCCRLDFPSTGPAIPETMTCPECNRYMEKFISFSCCHQ